MVSSSTLEIIANRDVGPANIGQLDEKVVLQQAEKIGKIILGLEDRLENLTGIDIEEYKGGWVKWLKEKSSGIKFKIADGILIFLEQNYIEEFRDVLSLCKNVDGGYSIFSLLGFLPKDLNQRIVRAHDLNHYPAYNATQLYNEELGSKLQEFLSERYGVDSLGENVLDMADLLHAAFFGKFDSVKDSHLFSRGLADYLTSTNRRIGPKDVFTPYSISLDSIVAFFNAYDDKQVIEDILYSIEQRKIFNELADETKPFTKNSKRYKRVFKKVLSQVLTSLRDEYKKSKLEGSKRILHRLINHYESLENFSIEGLKNDLDGWAFPRFYQSEAIIQIYRNKKYLDASDMGTGKTAVATLAARYIPQQELKDGIKRDGAFKTLMITTNTHKNKCKEKIAKYLDLDLEKILVFNGEERFEQYDRINDAEFVVINYELLRARDWKKADFLDWDVSSEKVEQCKRELREKYVRQSRSGKSELSFVLSQIKTKFCRQDIHSLDEAYIAYAKEKDLNEAKTVVRSIEKHFRPSYVIVDEEQNAKRSSSLNAKAILNITKNADYVACLSGTPFVNGLSDLDVLFNILGVYNDMISSLENKVRDLKKKRDSEGDLKLYRQTLSKLKRYIARGDIQSILLSNPRMVRDFLRPKMTRHRSEQVLDMPKLRIHPKNLDDYRGLLHLPLEQRMAYEILQNHDFKNSSDQLRALQMFLLSPGLYESNFKVAKNVRGEYEDNKPEMSVDIRKAFSYESSVKYQKLKALIKKVNRNKSKRKKNIVVFSSLYRVNVTETLAKLIGMEFPDYAVMIVDGTVVDKENDLKRTETIDQFNSSKKPAILFAMVPTMKEAMELEEKCSTAAFLDFPFTYADYAQPVARIWRGKQDEDCDIYNFMVANSLDIGKWLLIQKKRKLGDLLLEGAPLTKEELNILDINESNIKKYGFIESYIKKKNQKAQMIMRDLYGAGRDIVQKALGSYNARSEAYADAYLLNMQSDASVKSIFRDIMRNSGLKPSKIKSLDGKICDLGAAYGSFSHATGIATENLEINPIMIDRAKDFVAPGTNYTQGMMQDVNKIYGNSRFEHIIYSLTFHYASDEERGQLLFDIHKTLKQGGYLYLTEPLASIDNGGRRRLLKALRETGFEIKASRKVVIEDNAFYKIIAQKKGISKLFKQPFALRTFDSSEKDNKKDALGIDYIVEKAA